MARRDLQLNYHFLLNVVATLLVAVTIRSLLKLYRARCRFRQLSKDGAVGLSDAHML